MRLLVDKKNLSACVRIPSMGTFRIAQDAWEGRSMAFRLKKDQPGEETASAEGAPTQAEPGAVQPEASAAAETGAPVGFDPAASEHAKAARRIRSVFFGVSLIAALCVLAVIGMQAYEWYYYGQPPTVWLPK